MNEWTKGDTEELIGVTVIGIGMIILGFTLFTAAVYIVKAIW